MSAEIVPFTGITTLDCDPQRVLDGAKESCMTEVVILGYDANGEEYFASSMADAGPVIWHLERAKWRLMRQVDQLAEGDE